MNLPSYISSSDPEPKVVGIGISNYHEFFALAKSRGHNDKDSAKFATDAVAAHANGIHPDNADGDKCKCRYCTLPRGKNGL